MATFRGAIDAEQPETQERLTYHLTEAASLQVKQTDSGVAHTGVGISPSCKTAEVMVPMPQDCSEDKKR